MKTQSAQALWGAIYIAVQKDLGKLKELFMRLHQLNSFNATMPDAHEVTPMEG